MTTSNHQTWPACFRAHTRLRDLAPAEGVFRAFYGAFHLFQIGDQGYTVVDTCHGQRFGPHPMAEIVARYPGFGDSAALPVTPELDVALRAAARPVRRRSARRRPRRGGARLSLAERGATARCAPASMRRRCSADRAS
jgi:hypothetical protein